MKNIFRLLLCICMFISYVSISFSEGISKEDLKLKSALDYKSNDYYRWSRKYDYTLNNKESFMKYYKREKIFGFTIWFLIGYRVHTLTEEERRGSIWAATPPETGSIIMAYFIYKILMKSFMSKEKVEMQYEKKLRKLEERGNNKGYFKYYNY